MKPKFSICIPAYNRAGVLPALLDSIISQSFKDFEIVLSEDASPERGAIAAVVADYQSRFHGLIKYFENVVNLGYDGNLRRLIELAEGEYCLFMGNDDLLCEGALQHVAAALTRHPGCGVVVRSYASFEGDPTRPKQVFRYYPDEYFLQGGPNAIVAAYRRSVVISGMVIHRDAALSESTREFDGTLLYQLYLVGMILAHKGAVFVPQIIALRRDGTPPDFGNSDAERGKFVPNDQTPESSVHFMQGMLAIAKHIEARSGQKVFKFIEADIGNYAYPVLSIQARRPLKVFMRYGLDIARLGFWRYPLFYLYFFALLLLGVNRSDALIVAIKKRIGHTPQFGAARGLKQ